MSLPNFLIIGAAKCATTSLASLLDEHPQAAIVKGKEPHFFSYDTQYGKGLAYYESLFANCENAIAVGDASTSYSRIRQHPLVIQRIQKHLAGPKIIYMVRHPIDRIESAYIEQMTEPQNSAIRSINEAVKLRPMMIDSSRYWETYSSYCQAFGKANVHVIWFDEYTSSIETNYKAACRFLGIKNNINPEALKQNMNSRRQSSSRIVGDARIDTKWQRSTLKEIKKSLKKDNQKFLSYFGKPLSYWS